VQEDKPAQLKQQREWWVRGRWKVHRYDGSRSPLHWRSSWDKYVTMADATQVCGCECCRGVVNLPGASTHASQHASQITTRMPPPITGLNQIREKLSCCGLPQRCVSSLVLITSSSISITYTTVIICSVLCPAVTCFDIFSQLKYFSLWFLVKFKILESYVPRDHTSTSL
jgi:hypothetical protein